jgi:hypothetical protein
MADNSRAINRVFTRAVINDLLQKGSNEVFDYVVQRYANDPESKTHGQIISEIYAYLDHACIFKLLRKREYENILRRYFGVIPDVAPAFHFRACLECFKEIPIKEAQNMAFDELKGRNKVSKTIFEKIQPELKSTVYFAGLSRKMPQLEELLKSNYRR